MDYKVYVTLGFHINFYHSWRGDTPDEAGFGTDIRVIRDVLRMLDKANADGLQACGYWDTEVYWTFQEILPKHSPDILEGIRHRVDAGLDEIVLGPFNNGANHAGTADEFRASVAWSIENEWGSGLKQLFGKTAPLYRPQETMFTTGQETILKECGVDGIMLYYAGVPFNTISSFIPRLPDEQRYNPMWFRSSEDQPPLILLPCIAAGDLVEEVSLERLMLRLRKAQLRGEIRSDVLININEDADLETWLPTISWMPNMGGLPEFIQVVNRYPWAEFTLPTEYLRTHSPQAEVIVRQDLADGAFDGHFSWAEKHASLVAWTMLEQSRIHSCRAQALAQRSGMNLDALLWNGMQSSFFQRLIGLTTTHFGMSTPIINEERQNRACEILGNARSLAQQAEIAAAREIRQPESGALYEFELYQTPPARGDDVQPAVCAVRIPLVLPEGVRNVTLLDMDGKSVRASFTDPFPLGEGRTAGQLRFITDFHHQDTLRLRVLPADEKPARPMSMLKNNWIEVCFSDQGIETFTCNGEAIGGKGFLDPFITYEGKSWHAVFTLQPLPGESLSGLQRVRLKAAVPMQTADGEFSSEITYTFSLFKDLPYLLVDVDAAYAYTPPRQVIHNLTQKLRRLIDLNWQETAPIQLKPAMKGARENPLRVWKHNYLGITSYYDLDYARINPANHSLDAFNHQVTAGWVAVSDGRHGLLVAENADRMASMAFCPMRLREKDGVQGIALNPFGSYFGKQLDYSHLGGNGNGSIIMETFSGSLQPNGPSFNGETLEFSLLLAPYSGDAPPLKLQHDAAAHFYPPGVLVHHAPEGLDVHTATGLEQWIAAEHHRMSLHSGKPLDPPTAVLVNPSAGAVDLVWDAPRSGPVTGYEIQWRSDGEEEWASAFVENTSRWHCDGLVDGVPLYFRMRSLRTTESSDWTAEVTCTPGAVTDSSVGSMLGRLPLWTLLKVVVFGLAARIAGRFAR